MQKVELSYSTIETDSMQDDTGVLLLPSVSSIPCQVKFDCSCHANLLVQVFKFVVSPFLEQNEYNIINGILEMCRCALTMYIKSYIDIQPLTRGRVISILFITEAHLIPLL